MEQSSPPLAEPESSETNEKPQCLSQESSSSLHAASSAEERRVRPDHFQEEGLEQASSPSEVDLLVELASSSGTAEQSLDPNSVEQLPSNASAAEDSCCDGEEPELSHEVKKDMITDICKGVSIIACRSEAPGECCYVYLIGTAHVSEESCREVQAAVRFLKPQVVFLELCHKRTAILQRTSFVVPSMSDLIASWRQKKTNLLGLVYSWFLAKVAAKLDVHPGAEFRAAYEEAIACGAKVILGDRDVEVTLRRTWAKMSAWCKTKFIFMLLYQSIFLPKADQLNELIEKLKNDADILTIAFEELGKFSPTLMETVITERDLFMTAALQKIAEHHSSIVAVVGRGHVSGITKYWGQEIPIQSLLEVPKKRHILGLRGKSCALILLVAFVSALVVAVR